MTQSQQPVQSSPETTNHVKKRSYISKIFSGRRKSKERKEEKRRLALSSGGSDGVDQNNSPENAGEIVKNKKRKKRKKKDKSQNDVSKSNSDGNETSPNTPSNKKRVFFKKWGGKKKPGINVVSVELSDPSSESPPDLISSEARHSSVTPKSAERKKAQKVAKVKNDSNNNNDGKPTNTPTKVITSPQTNISNGVTSSTRHDHKPANNIREQKNEHRSADPIQYDSSTVGRKPIRRKQSGLSDPENDWSGFSRSRSFSGKSATPNHRHMAKKTTVNNQNVEDLPASKYAKMCRQSNQVLDMYTKDKNQCDKSGFLKWHSVGDIQRQIAGERSFATGTKESSSVIPPPLPAKTKKPKSNSSKSVSLQDLTFKDICCDNAQSSSVYERISRKCSRTTSTGQISAENGCDNKPRKPVLPNLKPHKMRPSLNKALSKSEANIWPSRREQCGVNNNNFRKATISPRSKQSDSMSPKRHSADVLEMRSPMVYPTYKSPAMDNQSWNVKHVKSNSDVNGVFFQYNMTEDALKGNYSESQPNHTDILYNHISPAEHPLPISSTYKLPYVSCHTDSLLRSSKSTGTLLGHDTTDIDISWAKTPCVGKSVYDQRAPLPDYTQDVEVLLSKLRSSLRDKAPPRPPKNSEMQYAADRARTLVVPGETCYPNQKYDADAPDQFRPLSSSPHRALPTASQPEHRGAGVSRSRSRARSIARRFNFSGSTENLSSSTPLTLCASSNWSTELDGRDKDVPEGYCRMNALIPPAQITPKDAHAIRGRRCPRPESTSDYVYLSGPKCNNTSPLNNCVPSSQPNNVKLRYKRDNTACSTSNGYPTVGGTFYYGRRPVSTSYAERTPTHINQYNGRQQHMPTTTNHVPDGSNCPPCNNSAKRGKVFYALDV